MPNDLKIEDVKQLKATPGATIIVTVDVALMPHSRAQEYMKAIGLEVHKHFPDNKIVTVPNTVQFEVNSEE